MTNFGDILNELNTTMTLETTATERKIQEDARNNLGKIMREKYDTAVYEQMMAPAQEDPFGIPAHEQYPPLKGDFDMGDTGTIYAQKPTFPTNEEMLVNLFSKELALIETLSIIADDENVLTMDIIIYILNDFFHPIEHK